MLSNLEIFCWKLNRETDSMLFDEWRDIHKAWITTVLSITAACTMFSPVVANTLQLAFSLPNTHSREGNIDRSRETSVAITSAGRLVWAWPFQPCRLLRPSTIRFALLEQGVGTVFLWTRLYYPSSTREQNAKPRSRGQEILLPRRQGLTRRPPPVWALGCHLPGRVAPPSSQHSSVTVSEQSRFLGTGSLSLHVQQVTVCTALWNLNCAVPSPVDISLA